MASISLRKVVKRYGSGKTANQVIHGVDAEIKDGEFVVVVGPSGCGKSTLLRMVAGLEEISGGEIAIGERVVNDLEPSDRDIAMVFQNYALYPHMTVYENMAFGLKLRKVPKAEIDEKVKEAADLEFPSATLCACLQDRHHDAHGHFFPDWLHDTAELVVTIREHE